MKAPKWFQYAKGRRQTRSRKERGTDEAPGSKPPPREETPGSPRADDEVNQQIEGRRERRRRQQEEESRRVEDARLDVGEPGFSRARQRVPQRHVAGRQTRGGVELDGIEEISLVAKGRRPVLKEGWASQRTGPASASRKTAAVSARRAATTSL